MAYASSRSRERARRRKALGLRIGRWVIILGGFAGIGYSSYEAGLALAELKVVALRHDLAEVTRERDNARSVRDNAQAMLTTAREQIANLQTRYDADVPKGAPAALLQLCRARLQDGITPERITEALRDVRPVTACEGRITTKRFPIRTTAQGTPDDTVTFADGLVSVHVTPTPDDAGRGLTAHFSRFAGPSSTASGAAALRHTVTFDNVELRFTITPSDVRGFAIVNMNSCGR